MRRRSGVQVLESAGRRIVGRRMPQVRGIAAGSGECRRRIGRLVRNDLAISATLAVHVSSQTGRDFFAIAAMRTSPRKRRKVTTPAPNAQKPMIQGPT